jgi:uncharacterized protein DUF4082
MKHVLPIFTAAMVLCFFSLTARAQTAPSTYSAYTGVDIKTIPSAPALGPANSVVTDPTFGTRILRVTDQNTRGGESFISTDAGSHRTWNANSTAIKLTGPHGDAYWLEFNPNNFTVGNGSSTPALHTLPFGASWEWSTVDPDIIYFLNGNQIGKYNKSTGVATNLGGPSNGDSVAYMAVVVGQDNWVCAAAGTGIQDSYTKLYCVNPVSPGTSKFIDVYNETVNGILQGDPNWPTSASGQVIGIHEIAGGTGASWLEVTFHKQSWGANGGAVLNLATNTWSLLTSADAYWSGHVSLGNGKYGNSGGSINGRDSRGLILRNPDNLMNSSAFVFAGQPPDTLNQWCDSDHTSWLNSVRNPGAPILISRYTIVPPCRFTWAGEIDAAATDGSNTVWRFAHTHNGGNCYYGQGFAQISNDGNWALFSSIWDGDLGSDTSFGCSTRIDTFIVQLSNAASSETLTPPSGSTSTSDLTIFGTTIPGQSFDNGSAVELGVKFRSDVNGFITGIRFYKGSTDTSPHTGSLWSSAGQLLATGSFRTETATGWQQFNFSTPVAINANTTYIASYHTSSSFFASLNFFQSQSADNAPLHALKTGVDGANGVYVYGSGGIFPNQTYLSANYWVDVIFSTNGTSTSPSTTPPPNTAVTDATIFPSSTTPGQSFSNSSGVELGVKFRSDANGFITGVRFYKGSTDTSPHTGSLWSSTGQLLATGTFTNETAGGWQQLNLATPVAISSNTTYIASYHTSSSFFATLNYFQSQSADNAPLHALMSGLDGPNGLYVYGSGGVFPNQSYISSNYWVDVVFSSQ